MRGAFSSFAAALMISSTAALAQRPPQSGQGSPQFSIENSFAWLMARPGVVVALVVMLGVLVYMIATRRKSGT